MAMIGFCTDFLLSLTQIYLFLICKVGPIAVRLHLLLETKYNTAALQQSDNFYLTFKTLTQAQASERWRSKDIQTRK